MKRKKVIRPHVVGYEWDCPCGNRYVDCDFLSGNTTFIWPAQRFCSYCKLAMNMRFIENTELVEKEMD